MKRPEHIFDLLEFSLSGAGLEAHERTTDMLSYEFNYESGLCLLAVIADRDRKRWFGTSRELVLMIFDVYRYEKNAPPVMSESMPFPKRPTDLEYSMRLVATLIAMAQASADTLGGGQSLSYAMPPRDRPTL